MSSDTEEEEKYPDETSSEDESEEEESDGVDLTNGEITHELLSKLNIKINTKHTHAGKTEESHPFSCNTCEENEEKYVPRFKTNYELNNHIKRVHLKEKHFICTHVINSEIQKQCMKAFASNSALTNHINTVHLKIRNFKCTEKNKDGTECKKAFANKPHLKRHVNACHSDNRTETCAYICNEIHDQETRNVCGMGFLDFTHLADHLMRYIGIYKFKCDHCEDVFVTEKELRWHMGRMHEENSKKIMCSVCDSFFFSISELNSHMHIHTGETPYKCNICKMAFAWSSNLTRHIRSHLGIKKYACQVENCRCSFVTSDELKRHHTSNHTNKAKVNMKKSEEETYKMLEQHLGSIRREYHVDFSCINKTFARIDFVYTMNDILFFIENDENQHKDNDVSYETQRMLDIKIALSEYNINLPIVWIRYNPHAYRVNDTLKKCAKEDRIGKVVEYIQECISNKELLPPVSYCYCFYDTNNTELCMQHSPEFAPEIKTSIHIIT